MTSGHSPEVRREVAGIRIPDSRLALEAEGMVRLSSSRALLNHAFRTYLFGELLGRKRRMRVDSELLFLGAIMHDLGLTEKFRGEERFEVDGADAARDFLSQRGVTQERSAIVWDAIALHTSLGIADRKQPEIALVHCGAGIDVAGLRLDELRASDVNEVIEAYPRLSFKNDFLESITRVVREKPRTAAFDAAADVGKKFVPAFRVPDFCDLVMAAPFDE
jgi:hypothetical protein